MSIHREIARRSDQPGVGWDTEELSDLLDWLRAYNRNVPDENKVRFYGVDMWRNDIGREAVLDYLRKVAPASLAATEMLFAALAREEAKWPLRIDAGAKETLLQLLPQLQAVIDHLLENQASFVSGSSASDFEQAVQYTRVMKQLIRATVADLLPPSQAKGTGRSICMAENLVYLADQSKPDGKCIIWAHNGHIGVADASIGEPNMGSYLRAVDTCLVSNELLAFQTMTVAETARGAQRNPPRGICTIAALVSGSNQNG
jgi:erythromycin esterase